jgi:hypothetical protein
MEDVEDEVFPPEQALRQIQSYAARLQSRWDELSIPDNDASANLITILHVEDAKEARLKICRESPVRERRARHPNEQGLLVIHTIHGRPQADELFYQTVPIQRVISLQALRDSET